MALTRKFLNAMGIEPEKVDEIIAAHTDTVDALKEQRDSYKADAEKLPAVQKELDEIKANAEKDGGKVWETKYNAMKEEKEKVEKELKDFKAETEAAATKEAKDKAYRALLKEIGVSEKRIDAVMKVTSLDDIELDEKGNIKDAENRKQTAKNEWADFIVTQGQQGASTATPPQGNGESRTPSRAAMVARKHYEAIYGTNATNANNGTKGE